MTHLLKICFKIFFITFLLIFIAPLGIYGAIYWSKGWPDHWRQADWTSANILPSPEKNPEALIAVYAARSAQWKGIFAVHSWIVIKPKDANDYERYEVLGWAEPVRKNAYPADGRWFSNEPKLVGSLTGEQASRLIPHIRKIINLYPYSQKGDYQIWPGPNSNTFIATILNYAPELDIVLPPTAIGKDFPVYINGLPKPEVQGVQYSLRGLIGFSFDGRQAFEFHILGLAAGYDWRRPAVKLPGFGRILI